MTAIQLITQLDLHFIGVAIFNTLPLIASINSQPAAHYPK